MLKAKDASFEQPRTIQLGRIPTPIKLVGETQERKNPDQLSTHTTSFANRRRADPFRAGLEAVDLNPPSVSTIEASFTRLRSRTILQKETLAPGNR